MTKPWDQGFRATAYWGHRAETPARCAKQFRQLLPALAKIHPSFSEWLIFKDPVAATFADADDFVAHVSKLSDAQIEERIIPLASLSERDVVEWISEEVARNDDKTPAPEYGYSFGATTGPEKQAGPRAWSVSVRAGNTISSDSFINTAKLESQPLCAANADLNTLQIFKPAMLALATNWEADWCSLRPAWDLPEGGPREPWFGFQWATYLCPDFAKLVIPPRSALTERFPDGGLLMIATEDRFDPSNLTHMAAAQDIAAALTPAGILP